MSGLGELFRCQKVVIIYHIKIFTIENNFKNRLNNISAYFYPKKARIQFFDILNLVN